MTEFLDLCYDVMIGIFEQVEPADLAPLSSTCWALNNFIKDNQRLWKAQYLAYLDDPRRSLSNPDPDWKVLLQTQVKCEKVLAASSVDVKQTNFRFVGSAIENLLNTASQVTGPSKNVTKLAKAFEFPKNLDAVVYRSSLYARAHAPSQAAEDEKDQQLSAKLHCLFGAPSTPVGRRSLSIHPYARATIYDLRNYTDDTKWGPYQDDGSMNVDWEFVEAIMIDLAYNCGHRCQRFKDFVPPFLEPFGGIAKDRVLEDWVPSLSLGPDLPLHMKDPYNITGEYKRIVCFLDYNDLYQFNFTTPHIQPDQPRGPIVNDEAIRHLRMRLQVTAVDPPGRFDNQALPIVHFTGTSKAIESPWDPNGNSKLRGSVRLTPEGEVRWTTISVFYGGEERWHSEGVQIGGRQSKRGVIGTWFDKDYDPHGPAGPTAFWKISDQIEDNESESEDEDEWHIHVVWQ